MNAVVNGAGAGDGGQKPFSLTHLNVTGAVSIEGGSNLSYVATNLTVGSGVEDITPILSTEIPSSSMGGTSAVAGTGGILMTLNFGIPACLTVITSALLAGTHTTKKHLKLTEPMIRSLATLVYIGKHDAHKIVHAQLMQHGNNNCQREIGKRLGPELGNRYMLGWEFQFLVPISGTHIRSGILIPFTIPKISVGFSFSNSAVEKSRNQNFNPKIWNSEKKNCRNSVHLISLNCDRSASRPCNV